MKFIEGFARLDVPLSPRYVEPAAGGHWVMLYGGSDTRSKHLFDDGALYDVDTQSWSDLPDAPFDAPLTGSAAAWSGREFIVIGTPCFGFRVDEDSVFCENHRPTAAAAFDPTTRRWRKVAVPDDDGLGVTGTPVPAWRPVGAANGRAIFTGGSGRDLLVLDADGAPGWIGPSPGNVDCVLDDQIFGFGAGDLDVGPAPPGSISPTRTWRYQDGKWVETGGLGPTTNETYGSNLGGSVTCNPTAVALVGLDGARGLGGEIDWFDPANGWTRLPTLAPGTVPALAASVAVQEGTPLVWIGTHLSSLQAGTWTPRSTTTYQHLFPLNMPPISTSLPLPDLTTPPTLAPVGRYLVGRPISGNAGTEALAFIDPEALTPT